MKYTGPIIDSDIHHRWTKPQDLLPYLSEAGKQLVTGGPTLFPLMPPGLTVPHMNGVNKRLDSYSPTGDTPGSHVPTLQKQLMEEAGVTRAVLAYDVAHVAGVRNPYLSVELCRAVNDWSIDRWLSQDSRFYGAIVVPTAMPTEAAKEIHRLGDDPRMSEVIVVDNTLAKPFGHPVYHPIYEAAAEHGLPIAIHVAGDSQGYAHTAAGGVPSNRLEFHTTLPQACIHHIISFITHGVFEKFPSLYLLLVEGGITWLPWALTQLDQFEKTLRSEPLGQEKPERLPPLERPLTTQPIEGTTDPAQLQFLFDSVGGIEDLLCFSTDYPHWDFDDPAHVAAELPEAWLDKVFYENATKVYGWDAAEVVREVEAARALAAAGAGQ